MKSLGGYYYPEEELKSLGFGSVGKNVKIHSKASLYGIENIYLGDHVRIDDFTVIIATGKLLIGNYVSIPNFCFLGAKNGITIGDFVTFAPGVKIFSASDDYEGNRLTGVAVPAGMTGGIHAPVVIENHVIIGTGSVILPGVLVAEGCAVGALSLVKGSLEPWGVYSGIPVVRRKNRKKDLLKLADKLMCEIN
ncbi:MAG TPA: acyltransferase [Chlamydiales bacterium]|nr:acyltransferase [Chlamydiales bacterium]